MGGRGSGGKPKPTLLKRLHRSGEPINEHEPLPEGDLTATADTAPAHFDDEQRAAWNYALEHSPPGMLKNINSSVVQAWVVAYCLHCQAVKEFNDTGKKLLDVTPNGQLMQSALLPIIRREALLMSKLAAELGFSPTARPRINAQLNGGDLGRSALTKAPSDGEETLDQYLARAPDTKIRLAPIPGKSAKARSPLHKQNFPDLYSVRQYRGGSSRGRAIDDPLI